MKDKRDILGTDTELDRISSGTGNSSAHGGDVFWILDFAEAWVDGRTTRYSRACMA